MTAKEEGETGREMEEGDGGEIKMEEEETEEKDQHILM